MNIRTALLPLLCLPSMVLQAHDHAHGEVASDGRVQYVANLGQWQAGVRYKAAFPTSAMYLQDGGVTWVRMQDDAADLVHEYIQWSPAQQAQFRLKGHAWRMEFVGADATAVTRGENKRKEYHNYFLGNDPTKWASNVPVYEGVHYDELWPGVDMHWYSEGGQVKYDLLVAAGADASSINFRYDGLDGLVLGKDGSLVMRTSVGEMREMKPVAWYADDRSPLVCAFKLEGTQVGFAFPQGVDPSRAVVIDPLLMGASYSGQTGASNYGHCATYDEAGNMYGGAQNFGIGLPTTPGAFQTAPGGGWGTDIIVNKFTPDATTLLFATYIGGDADDKPHSMIVNSNNELCILGSADGPNFPTTAGAYDASHNGGSDIVLVHLNLGATALIGSTYLGGSSEDGRQSLTNNYGDTYRGEIMLDGADNIYIASSSSSSNFPVTAGAFQGSLAGAQDAVVVGVSPNCSALLMSTYLGGSNADNGLGLRFDGLGSIYVCGGTSSSDFPMVGGGYQATYQGGDRDGYVVRVASNGASLQNTTFFGTSGDDMAYFIDLDNDNDVYIYGQSDGSVPVWPAGTYGQAGGSTFLAAFEPNLANAVFTTSLGEASQWGGWNLAPVAFLVDVCEHIYISGYNPSGAWETTPDALYQQSFSQFYLAAYDVDMTGILFGSYYGGSHVDGGTSRFDKDGIIYQGVCSGGNSMPTTATAYAPSNNVGWDLGVFKIDFQVAGVNAAGASTLNSGCAPVQIDFNNNSTGTEWLWDFGDGSPQVNAFEPSHTYTTPGAFTVMMIAMDSLSCNLADTTYLPITIGQAQPLTAAFTVEQTPDCALLEVVATNTSTGTPLAFEWDMGDGTQLTDTNATHGYTAPGDYDIRLIAYDPTGCSQPDTVVQTVTVAPPLQVVADFDVVETPGCDQVQVQTANTSTGTAPTYIWDMDGTQYTTDEVDHLFLGVGTYTITLIANDPASCNGSDTLAMDVTVDPSVPVAVAFTAGQTFDCDDLLLTTDNQSTGTNLVFDWQLSDGTQSADTNLVHVFSGAGTYTVTLTVSDALGCSPSQSTSIDVTIDPLVPVVADFVVEQVGDCSLLNINGLNLSTGDSVSYSWNMGDGTVLTDTDVQYAYTQPGQYPITLTVTDLGCGQNDELSITVEVRDQLLVPYIGDTVICPGSVAVLNVLANNVDYLWSNGSTAPSITVDEPGTYTVVVSDSLCVGTASVDVIAAPVHMLFDSVQACPKAFVDLQVPIEGLSYSWATGGNERMERVQGPGIYTYDMVDLYGCPHSDSLKVVALDSIPQLFAPNAFTPDGDGVNDTFLISGFGEQGMSMSVFNRWGERLWETTSLSEPWNGAYGGGVVQDGVYVYLLKYIGVCDAEEREMIGHVTVVR